MTVNGKNVRRKTAYWPGFYVFGLVVNILSYIKVCDTNHLC